MQACKCRTLQLQYAETIDPTTSNGVYGYSRMVHVDVQDKATFRHRTPEWLGQNEGLQTCPLLRAQPSVSSRAAAEVSADGMHTASGMQHESMLSRRSMSDPCSLGAGAQRPMATQPAQHGQGSGPEPPSSLSRASRCAPTTRLQYYQRMSKAHPKVYQHPVVHPRHGVQQRGAVHTLHEWHLGTLGHYNFITIGQQLTMKYLEI